ncbi:divalent-cation tolerance protein CutA [Kribbella sp. NPDC059898]|uniref:divalent-cation tolerance protein CutA n=1 Tax=Kribbella sp. NPDC059898 TaxID=3346995 RepID=UPI003662DF2F
MTNAWQVSTTAASHEAAVKLASSAVREGLAASAQILGPATTMVWHEGEFAEIEEWQLTFMTLESRFDDLHEHLLETHAWNNPQVTAVPIVAISVDYQTWLHRTLDLGSHGE